jgi:hypothetical protein
MNRFLKSWKTTSAGIISVVSGVVLYFNDKTQIVESLTLVLSGVGFLFSKDYNKSDVKKDDPIIAPPPEIGGGGITNPKPPKP